MSREIVMHHIYHSRSDAETFARVSNSLTEQASCNSSSPKCEELFILSDATKRQIFPAASTSGYVSLSPDSSIKPPGKCSHGGALDLSKRSDAAGFGINKNNYRSDHKSYHVIAAKIALKATIQHLNSLWMAVGNETFGRFMGLGSSSLVIAIDTTGSMGPYIQMVKQIAIGIVEATQGPDAQYSPANYILSPFNDPTWGPLFITHDPQALIVSINNLTAYGGGDLPELYYHGLSEALQVCEIDSLMYTFTDAPAKDAQLRPQVLARAIQMNTRIFSFYVGGRLSTGRMRRDVYEELYNGDDIATASGGSTIGINYGSVDINATKAFITRRLFPRQSLLTLSTSNPMNVTFIVDIHVTRLLIDITSSTRLILAISNSIRLVDPNGFSVIPIPVSSSSFFHLFSVNNPIAGRWILLSNHYYTRTIDVSSQTNLNSTITMSCITTLSQKIEQELTMAYAPFLTLPIIGQTDLVLVTACSNLPAAIQSVNVQLINTVGRTIITYNASNTTDNGLAIVPLIIPSENFRILSSILLLDGTMFQRQSNFLVSPTPTAISILNQPYTLRGPSPTHITYQIDNQGREPLHIQMCALDTLNLLDVNGNCITYTVANMSHANGTLTMN